VVDTEFSAGLHLELEADLQGEPAASLAVGLVDQTVIPQSTEQCGGVATSFPLLVGVSLFGSHVEAVIGGLVRSTTVGRNKGRQRARLEVGTDSIRFYLDDRLFHEAAIKMSQPYPRAQVLIEGRGAAATVDNLLLARRSGCPTPARWDAGPAGPGPALSPSGDSKRFDATTVSDPSVLFDGAVYRLYYTGGASKTAVTRLGLAISTDGQLWTRGAAPLEVAGEDAQSLAEPAVIAHEGQYLMAYSSRAGDLRRVALASSSDGQSWTRMATVVSPGDSTAWDSVEVGSPALAYFRHRFHVWYVGRGSGASLPALGLATSETGTLFTRDVRNPVFVPAVGAHDDRGVTDPWVLPAGGALQLWYVGLTWGGRTQINLAASEDGKNWIRYPKNPVVPTDDPRLFGSAGLSGPTLLDRWGTLHLWYGGTDAAGLPAIGQAVNTGRP
jgi:predicted GH43/DUF377 family glycosyl hydrolase